MSRPTMRVDQAAASELERRASLIPGDVVEAVADQLFVFPPAERFNTRLVIAAYLLTLEQT